MCIYSKYYLPMLKSQLLHNMPASLLPTYLNNFLPFRGVYRKTTQYKKNNNNKENPKTNKEKNKNSKAISLKSAATSALRHKFIDRQTGSQKYFEDEANK